MDCNAIANRRLALNKNAKERRLEFFWKFKKYYRKMIVATKVDDGEIGQMESDGAREASEAVLNMSQPRKRTKESSAMNGLADLKKYLEGLIALKLNWKKLTVRQVTVQPSKSILG